jgi:predicted nucleic-acid-binding Zn-ribbon protein
MDKARQEQVIIALKEKGATQPCPRCNNLEFEILGETQLQIFGRPPLFGLPAPHLYAPVVLISCKRCGYIAQHSKGVLGLTG